MNIFDFAPDYASHPMLDPDFVQRDPVSARALERSLDRMSTGEEAHNRHLNRLLNPEERPLTWVENVEAARRYLVDVNAYLHEILQLVTPDARKALMMDPEVAATNEILGLLTQMLRGDSPRLRYEAQRKLYLAKLLFDIDHHPEIQMGPVHKAYFEETLTRNLWSRASRAKPVDLYFDLAADGLSMDIRRRRTRPEQEKWRFHLIRIREENRRPVHVYHYACRFKREVAPFHYERGEAEYRVMERPIFDTLHERRSGSILSKMIRKGEVHARKIQDIIGAMFIVNNTAEVESLQQTLFDVFGGPLRFKDRINTILHPEEAARLNAQSGRGYEVLKSDVDIVYQPPWAGLRAYIFSVEIQIYTVEGFLRTVHSRHYASHQHLKQRQFIEGLLPQLYPMALYGDAVQRCLLELSDDGATPARSS